jgi:hypothetical protein
VAREEVRDVEIVWVEDGDCGGSNEDVVSAQVETLDEVSPIVMLDLEDEDVLASEADATGIIKVSSDSHVHNHGKQLNKSKKKVSG